MAVNMASNKQPLNFRLATLSEADHLAALINAAFRNEKTGQTWLYDEQEKRVDIVSGEVITSILNSSDTDILVGVLPGESSPVACCALRAPSEPPQAHMSEGAAWLSLFATSPQLQRGGYGLSLLLEAQEYVRKTFHARRLEMDYVSTRVELAAWYARCGFHPTGKKRDFPYGGRRDILADGLESIVLGKDL